MKVIIERDYETASKTLASVILSEFYKDGRINVDLTDGTSPTRAYEIVAETFSSYPKRFENVHFYNHAALEDGGQNLVGQLLDAEIHQQFKTNPKNIHTLDAYKKDQYIEDLFAAGGLDLMVLGLGADGHFCVNFPTTTIFDEYIYSFDTTELMKQYSDHEVSQSNDAPKNMVTFGYRMVNTAKRLVVFVNGKEKAKAVRKMLNDDVDASFPATILKLHPNLLVILDEDAASEL